MAKRKPVSDSHDLNDMMRTVTTVAKLGDLFCDTVKEKNAWKKRMLVAGLGKMALSFPDDWDSLSEDEKERRLNLAIEAASQTKED